MAVNDEEIVQGMRLLAETEDIFAETAGGVTIASLVRKAKEGIFNPDDTIVCYITGNGLKTQEAVVDEVARPYHIQPTLESFEAAYNKQLAAAGAR